MLKIPVSHPEILHALGSAGHLSKILISDGHYPHGTHPNPRAKIVWANFTPGVLDAVTVLKMVADLVSIEKVEVMEPHRTGPYAMKEDPPIWRRFDEVLREHSDFRDQMTPLQKPAFNDQARSDDVCLVIATAETEIYANILVTIGVVNGGKQEV
jgi:L-fucose mutarotase